MKRVIALSLICSLLFQTVSPAFAQSAADIERAMQRKCPIEKMLHDATASQWVDLDCIFRVIDAVRNANGEYQKDKKVVRTIAQVTDRLTNKALALLRDGKVEEALQFESAVNQLGDLIPDVPIARSLCVNIYGKPISCETLKKEKQMEKEKQSKRERAEKEKKEDSKSSIKIKGTDSTDMPDFSEYFHVITKTADMEAKIYSLSQLDKKSLIAAIEVMAAKGSDDPKKSAYIHPAIINSAFMFLADKVEPTEKGLITKYLYDKRGWVAFAAANALESYANIDNKSEETASTGATHTSTYMSASVALAAPKFVLHPSEIRQVALCLEYAPSAAASLVFSSSMLAKAGLQFTAAELRAIAVSAAESVAAIGSSSAAALGTYLGVFLGVGIVCVYELNNSLAPMLANNWVEYKRNFWDKVFSGDVPKGYDIVDTQRAIDIDLQTMGFVTTWTESLAKIGARALSIAKSSPRATCQYSARSSVKRDWTLSDLDIYLNTGDPVSARQAESLRDCLGRYGSLCPRNRVPNASLFAGCQNMPLKNIEGTCQRDIRQLKRVNDVASSFYSTNTNEPLFTRAVFQKNMKFLGGGEISDEGSWIPEAEIGIKFDGEDLFLMFVDELKDSVLMLLADSLTIVNVNKRYSRFRRGAHERNNQYRWNEQERKFDKKQTNDPFQHFHYEEFLTYPDNNPYICNHSIFYHVNVLKNVLRLFR
ncbi:MAG: hypothetical protein ACI351_01060 [Candidatus Avelusimicrobium sp.]|uniref:hypothetical protein n=1 Tax=Candidatus Avelusimicrobium sp. TaxID=3048833 RepID=UPI003F0EDD2F